jgi:hypothetical protein
MPRGRSKRKLEEVPRCASCEVHDLVRVLIGQIGARRVNLPGAQGCHYGKIRIDLH